MKFRHNEKTKHCIILSKEDFRKIIQEETDFLKTVTDQQGILTVVNSNKAEKNNNFNTETTEEILKRHYGANIIKWYTTLPESKVVIEYDFTTEGPYTKEEILNKKTEDGYIEGIVYIPIYEAIGEDNEFFYDTLSERLVGSPLLCDITYRVIGIDDNENLIVSVRGSVEEMDLY